MSAPKRHFISDDDLLAAVKEHGEARGEEAQLNGTEEQGEDHGDESDWTIHIRGTT